MVAKRQSPTLNYYLSLEHGSDTDRVPRAWRDDPRFGRLSLYGLSSLNYSLTGCLLLALLHLSSEQRITASRIEAAFWVWQGLISYQCDVVDIGIRSWSHPVDRISATIFTVQQAVKYIFLVRCSASRGRYFHFDRK